MAGSLLTRLTHKICDHPEVFPLHDRVLRILIELCPELGRADAAALLDRADGRLKTAILMQRLDVDCATAERLLENAGGRLRVALEADS